MSLDQRRLVILLKEFVNPSDCFVFKSVYLHKFLANESFHLH